MNHKSVEPALRQYGVWVVYKEGTNEQFGVWMLYDSLLDAVKAQGKSTIYALNATKMGSFHTKEILVAIENRGEKNEQT